MGGGHGPDAGHGHGGGSGHVDAHAGGQHAADAHGPAEIPPAPAERFISPARADFEQPWPGRGLLWPLVWTGVAGVLALFAVTWHGPILSGEHGGHGGHEAAPEGGGEAPAHSDPAPGVQPEKPAESPGMSAHGG